MQGNTNFNNKNYSNAGAISHYDENQSIYDSKYSPSRGGANATAYSKDLYTANNDGFYDWETMKKSATIAEWLRFKSL